MVQRLPQWGTDFLGLDEAPTHVRHDPSQPGPEAVIATQALQPEECLKQPPLGRVARGLFVAQQAQRHSTVRRAMVSDEGPEGLAAPGACQCQESM